MLSEQAETILLLILCTRKRSLYDLQSILSKLGTLKQNHAITILNAAKRFLSQSERDWLEGTMKRLYHDPENTRRLMFTAWLWVFPKESEPLVEPIMTRVSAKDKKTLQSVAEREGMSLAEITRKAVREYLNAKV